MSHSHNSRRKTIKKFKKLYKNDWYNNWVLYCDDIRRKLDGPLIGNLQEIMDSYTKNKKNLDGTENNL